MNEQELQIRLMNTYGSDVSRWPEEHRELGDPTTFDPLTQKVWQEACWLDQRLLEDVIPSRSTEIRHRINRLISGPPATFLERWFLSLKNPWRPALVHGLILCLGILTSDLAQHWILEANADEDDALAWAQQYLGDDQP